MARGGSAMSHTFWIIPALNPFFPPFLWALKNTPNSYNQIIQISTGLLNQEHPDRGKCLIFPRIWGEKSWKRSWSPGGLRFWDRLCFGDETLTFQPSALSSSANKRVSFSTPTPAHKTPPRGAPTDNLSLLAPEKKSKRCRDVIILHLPAQGGKIQGFFQVWSHLQPPLAAANLLLVSEMPCIRFVQGFLK